jgi:hypothetical protein
MNQEIKRITKATYRAAGNVVAAASTAPFLEINLPAAGRVMRIKRITLSGMSLTAVAYLRLAIQKFTAVHTAGTPVSAVVAKLDAGGPAAVGTVRHFTAAPTPGAGIEAIGERRALAQATTAVAAGMPDADISFRFGDSDNNEDATLRTIGHNISVAFAAAPATAVTLSYEIEWTEDGN